MRDDLWIYIAVAVVWLAVLVGSGVLLPRSELPEWLAFGGDAKRGFRYAQRVVGMLVYGLFYLRLRRFYKAAEISAESAPNPWVPALGAIAAGMAIAFVSVALGAVLAR